MASSRVYPACATQRSESTLLCRLLSETGVAGQPREYFEAEAETARPPHPGEFLAGLPATGLGIRDDVRPPRAPDYSSLQGLPDYRAQLQRTLASGTGPQRRVRRQDHVQPAAEGGDADALDA